MLIDSVRNEKQYLTEDLKVKGAKIQTLEKNVQITTNKLEELKNSIAKQKKKEKGKSVEESDGGGVGGLLGNKLLGGNNALADALKTSLKKKVEDKMVSDLRMKLEYAEHVQEEQYKRFKKEKQALSRELALAKENMQQNARRVENLEYNRDMMAAHVKYCKSNITKFMYQAEDLTAFMKSMFSPDEGGN